MNIKVAIAQINPIVGNLRHNLTLINKMIDKARSENVSVLILGQLALSGYHPEDFLYYRPFIEKLELVTYSIIKNSKGISIVLPTAYYEDGKLYNGVKVISDQKFIRSIAKSSFAVDSIIDDRKYFAKGYSNVNTIEISGFKIGIMISDRPWEERDQILAILSDKPDMIFAIAASPFETKIKAKRVSSLSSLSSSISKSIGYANIVGGADELLFDGSSFFVDHEGKVVSQALSFKEDLITATFEKTDSTLTLSDESYDKNISQDDDHALLYNAIVLAVKDYAEKNNFKSLILGLSGGIDSALTATIAKDALGKENVQAVLMPTKFSSESSISDAMKLVKNLGIKSLKIDIEDIRQNIEALLDPHFQNIPRDATEENIQARIRGLILMALSNKFGSLLLATGNKSEACVGYATLYGDTAGGFAPIKDIFKKDVKALSLWKNLYEQKEIIPIEIINKEPSAELSYNQKDSDSLPEYPVLDEILTMYVEERISAEDIIRSGFEKDIVLKVRSLVDKNEYKRRQAPIGPKVSKRSLGKDRHYPVTFSYCC